MKMTEVMIKSGIDTGGMDAPSALWQHRADGAFRPKKLPEGPGAQHSITTGGITCYSQRKTQGTIPQRTR